jgi:hypothetical protein
MNNAGLITLPLDFSSSWYFQKPIIYLLNWEYGIENGQNQSILKLEYVVLENEPLTTKNIGELRKHSRTTGRIRVNHQNPLRFAHVSLEYSRATNWFKRSKTRLFGHLPNEQYLLTYKNASWQITGTTKPGKTS